MNNNSFEIVERGNIIIKCVNSSFIVDSKKDAIQKIWNEECKNKNYKLFNGEALSIVDIHKEGRNIIVNTKFTEYKNILASRKNPQLGLNIKQLGVSGITIVDHQKKFILFSARSADTTEYPGYLELVPSGNIDKSVLLNDGTVDYISKIKEEFKEETGLSPTDIKDVKSFCLVYDKVNQVFDVGCLIYLDIEVKEIIKSFNKVSEYGIPELVPREALTDFMKQNQQKIVPTSLAILECFINMN
ncbi:MAG: hypothetical protein QXW38_09665 [Candidatus Nitrosotenuis sp.]